MALDIKWERPDQRLALTVTAPLFVEIDGQRCKATEWSLEGFKCAASGWELQAAGARRAARLTLPFQGFEMTFDATCDVERDPGDADLIAGRFVDLGTRERELMTHFVEELLRGSMVPVRDTIQRIDVPVAPTRLTPDASPGAQNRKRRSFLMTALYGALGIGVLGYLGLMTYASFFRMEVQSAMISAPTEMVAAQGEGRIKWGDFKPGDAVRTGDVVVRLIDNALEREIEVAEVAIREREARLTFMRRRERNGVERLQSMPVAELRQLTRAKMDLDELRTQLGAAEGELLRMQAAENAASEGVEALKTQIADLKSRVEAKEFDLRTRKDTVNRASVGRKPAPGTPTGSAIVGSLDDLEAQIELARQEVQFAKERHAALLNQRERLVVRAPFDGRIVDLPHVNNGSIRKGDIVAILEQAQPRNVTAYLNDDEIARVKVGDPAKLYVPAVRELLTARVERIDRSYASGRELDPQTGMMSRWRGSTSGGAKVILAFEDAARAANAEKFRAGLPVVVIFERGGASRLPATSGTAAATAPGPGSLAVSHPASLPAQPSLLHADARR